MAKIDYDEIAKHYGTPNLIIDKKGNIRDMMTGKIVAPAAPNERDTQAHLAHLREHFGKLPRAVQEGVLEHARQEAIKDAIDFLSSYDDKTHSYKLNVSYEQLAAWASETVLLEEDK